MQHVLHETLILHTWPVAWLMLLPQLPAQPSSLRVSVWRKLKQMGAHGLQSGVWLLPDQPEQHQWLLQLTGEIQAQAGTASLWRAEHLHPLSEQDVQAAFNHDRQKEYAEVQERCSQFLAEVARETALDKFDFAELEELEQDVHKLGDWLARIARRDWFTEPSAETTAALLRRCEDILQSFAAEVYRRAGLDASRNEE